MERIIDTHCGEFFSGGIFLRTMHASRATPTTNIDAFRKISSETFPRTHRSVFTLALPGACVERENQRGGKNFQGGVFSMSHV